MSQEYVEKRIRDALKKTHGNATKARQQIIAWTYEDSKLLHAITRAHLSGIVAYNIERVLSGRSSASGAGAAEQAARANSASGMGMEASNQQEEHFGKELLKAVAGNSGATFGLEGYSAPRKRPPKVSQGHIDAIKAMTRGSRKT